MSDRTFDVYCPQCNILIEAKVIASGNGTFASSGITPDDIPDAEYRSDHFSVALCGRCSQPFLIKEALFGIPAEFETVTSEDVLYPVNSSLPLVNLPKGLDRAYGDAARSFGASLYDPCVLMCRKCIEIACREFGVTESNLMASIDKMAEAGHIDRRLKTWAHGVRVLGNEAAHDTDSRIDKQDARDSLDFTEALLLYLFTLARRFETFIARRAKPV